MNGNPVGATQEEMKSLCVDTWAHEIVGLNLSHESARYCFHTHAHPVITDAGNTEEDHTQI